MSAFDKDIIFMIRQFLDEGKYKETVHKLEQESGLFFNMDYFEIQVKQGKWDEVERYLLSFITAQLANRHSIKMIFEIRKQKYLEALDMHDNGKAVEILMKDLKVFKSCDEELYKKLTQLVTLENFRQNPLLSSYGDTNSARANLFLMLKSLILENPALNDKLNLPSLETSRLHTLVTQSLNWQHVLSLNPPLPGAHQNNNTRNLEVVRLNSWKLTEISDRAHCRSLCIPDDLKSGKILRFAYTSSGNSMIALTSKAAILVWKWPQNEQNLTGKVTTSICPQLWQPRRGDAMINDISDISPVLATPGLALSNNDCYVLSSSGGMISLFNTRTFERIGKFMPPPPAVSVLLFYPEDNNIFIVGMDDAKIKIYHSQNSKISTIHGAYHIRRITGLAFSRKLNLLISSDADAQICVWKWSTLENHDSTNLITLASRRPVSDTRVQFMKDQIHFLVVHRTMIAVYETTRLERVKQWMPQRSSVAITDAALSCDDQLVFASFRDATVSVFSAANLELQCRIHPSAYIPSNVRYFIMGGNSTVHPLLIAAHPSKPNQFTLILNDGDVHVLEPLEPDRKWGEVPRGVQV